MGSTQIPVEEAGRRLSLRLSCSFEAYWAQQRVQTAAGVLHDWELLQDLGASGTVFFACCSWQCWKVLCGAEEWAPGTTSLVS